jgi:hypothetical protein
MLSNVPGSAAVVAVLKEPEFTFLSNKIVMVLREIKVMQSTDRELRAVFVGNGPDSSPGKGKIFLFSKASRPTLGPTQPPIQWVSGAFSPGVKRPGREADHSPPCDAELKKGGVYLHSSMFSWHSA